MFSSEKDLRKPVAKKSTTASRPNRQNPSAYFINSSSGNSESQNLKQTTGTGTGPISISESSNILEVTRLEREKRALNRERSVYVVRLQTWWRCQHTRHLHCAFVSQSIKTKLSDIDKLAAILHQKGVEFVPPPPICMALVSQYLHLQKYSKSGHCQLLQQLCSLVINPSITEMDATKNILAFQLQQDATMRLLSKFFCAVLAALSPPATSRSKSFGKNRYITPENIGVIDRAALAYTLQLMLGTHAPFKMRFTAELEAGFRAIRIVLTEKHQLIARIRAIFMQKSEVLLSIMNDRDGSDGGVQSFHLSTTQRPQSATEIDRLLMLMLFLVEVSSDNSLHFLDTLTSILTQLWTVPMLTLIVTADTLSELCRWRFFPQLLYLLADPVTHPLQQSAAATGPSCLNIIKPGQWLLGNLASLSLFVPYGTAGSSSSGAAEARSPGTGHTACIGVTIAPESKSWDSDTLLSYINTCTIWLSAFGIADVLQGRSGIIWLRQGSSSTAVAVPAGLEEQLLTLLHPKVLQEMSRLVIYPIPLPGGGDSSSGGVEAEQWTAKYGLSKDIKDVAESLASSAYVITHRTLVDHREASTWFTAKWAKKVANNFSSGFGLPSFPTFSSASKPSASAQVPHVNRPSGDKKVSADAISGSESPVLVAALCRLWAHLMSSAASSAPDSLPWKALSQLAFSGRILSRLWCFLLSRVDPDRLAGDFHLPDGSIAGTATGGGKAEHIAVLFTLVCVLRMVLVVLDDSELYDASKPFPLHQIVRIVRCLKVVLFKSLQQDPDLFTDLKSSPGDGSAGEGHGSRAGRSSSRPEKCTEASVEVWTSRMECERRVLCHTMRAASAVLADLYSRWARRPFSSSALWEIPETNSSSFKAEIQQHTPVSVTLLRTMPWAVDFHERMKLFRATLDAERLQIQGSNDYFSGGPQRSRGVIVRVRKTRVLEDGMEAMARVGAAIKDRVVVKYINDFGEEEAGIDAGGLFKDFVTDLSGRIFDPSYGLFSTTPSNLLYPNPSAAVLFDPHEMDTMFVFLGRVLGKALFENITLQPQFAHFFLAFMHGKYNYMNLINDLHTLDPELYKNLMFLKIYEGDIADLGLTFAVTDTAMGGQKEVELLPGGAAMDITSQNRHRYINLAAKYYLHDRIKRQAKAFFSGLHQVVGTELLGMFCAPELQILISGSQAGLSVDDLRAHTRYAGGYLSVDRHVLRFWSVFAELSVEDQAALLKFVTSCERPPSLGFASLQPPFTIQRVDCSDDQRLPTASTCFNILKLPTYSSSKVMREKLLQSIHSKAGFDLS